jgi:hypothetical protein
MRFNTIILIFCFLLFAYHSRSQPADSLIEQYIGFLGGEAEWKKVKTLVTAGEYNYGGIIFPFTAYSKAPDRYKFVVPFEGKYYAQAYDGEQGWKIDAFKNETQPTLLTGAAARAMANEAEVELEDAFINYRKKGHRALLEGIDTLDGKVCSKVKLIRQSGAEETYYFDASTGALIMKTCLSKNAELPGTMLDTSYSDYRDVGEIKIPFKIISRSGDQTILEVTVNKAEINSSIANSEFRFKP